MIKKQSNGSEASCPLRTAMPGIIAVLVIILLVNFILTLGISQKVKGLYQAQIGQLWGSEVMQLLSEKLWDTPSFKKAQLEAVSAYIEQMGGSLDNDTDTVLPNTPSETLKEVDATTLANLSDGAHVLGNPDGDILMVLYADYLCSYCNRMHDDGTIQAIVNENPNVGVIMKQVALFGEQSVPGAKTAYCVGKLGNDQQYFEVVDKGYTAKVGTADAAIALAKEIWISEADFTACYNDSNTTDAVNGLYLEGLSLFDIGGTPATVVINKTTGAYKLVGGAAPKINFVSAIASVS